jgi:transcriptional antiterminator NusG
LGWFYGPGVAGQLSIVETKGMEMHWYVLRVAANKEGQVKEALERKTEQEGLSDMIGRIEVPTEQIKRIRGGKQTVHRRKLYPGYVFMD